MSSPAAIVLDRVTKVYDEPVVFDVSLEVQEGEFVTLLGPSGSGKTTILQMIGGFVQPTTGRIFFGGTDMTTLPPNKRPCNTIFQDLGLFPHMTVAENVAYGLKVRGVDAPTRREAHIEHARNRCARRARAAPGAPAFRRAASTRRACPCARLEPRFCCSTSR